MTPEDYERELARKDNELEAIKALLMTQSVPDEVKRLQDDLAAALGAIESLKASERDVDAMLDQATGQHEAEIAVLGDAHAKQWEPIEGAVEDLCVSFGLPRRPSPVDLSRWPALKKLVDLVQL